MQFNFKVMLKIRFATTILFVLITSAALSQHSVWGIYGSPNMNYRILSDKAAYLDDYDEKVRLINWGISYERYLTKRISVISGMEHSINGYNRKPLFVENYVYTIKSRLHYISIPTAVNYYLISKSNFKVGLYLGLDFKYLIFAKYSPYKIERLPSFMGYVEPLPPKTITYTLSDLKKDDYNIFNVDALAGLRVGFFIDQIAFSVSPEFHYALRETVKQSSKFHTDKEILYSYGLKLMVGLNRDKTEQK